MGDFIWRLELIEQWRLQKQADEGRRITYATVSEEIERQQGIRLTISTIGRYHAADVVNPTMEVLSAFALYYKRDVTELIGREGDAGSKQSSPSKREDETERRAPAVEKLTAPAPALY